MTVLIWFDKIHYRHKGPKFSAEIPERIDVILQNLPLNISIQEFVIKDDDDSGMKESLSRYHCEFCTFELSTFHLPCLVCGNVSSNQWKYVSQIEGDTTYITPDTQIVIKHMESMILKAIDTQVKLQNNFTFCLTRPPGHHACSNRIAGFCHKNFAIFALDYLHHQYQQKCLILDIDAHYGDGTVAEIQKRNYGTYVSIHGFGKNIYPGTGDYLVNEKLCVLPVSPNANHHEWLIPFKKDAIPFILQFKPDMIILSAGFDGHHADKIAPLSLDTELYSVIGKELHNINIPIFAVLEGGYELSVLGESISALVKEFNDF